MCTRCESRKIITTRKMFSSKWRFFPVQFMALVLRTLAINSSGKIVSFIFCMVPPSDLVRAINKLEINSLTQLACPNLFSTEITNTKKPAIQESPQSQFSVVNAWGSLDKDASTRVRPSSERITPRFCNYFSIIPSNYNWKTHSKYARISISNSVIWSDIWNIYREW